MAIGAFGVARSAFVLAQFDAAEPTGVLEIPDFPASVLTLLAVQCPATLPE